jgi:hypothetical protein
LPNISCACELHTMEKQNKSILGPNHMHLIYIHLAQNPYDSQIQTHIGRTLRLSGFVSATMFSMPPNQEELHLAPLISLGIYRMPSLGMTSRIMLLKKHISSFFFGTKCFCLLSVLPLAQNPTHDHTPATRRIRCRLGQVWLRSLWRWCCAFISEVYGVVTLNTLRPCISKRPAMTIFWICFWYNKFGVPTLFFFPLIMDSGLFWPKGKRFIPRGVWTGN